MPLILLAGFLRPAKCHADLILFLQSIAKPAQN
jgi:hypothetical protein